MSWNKDQVRLVVTGQDPTFLWRFALEANDAGFNTTEVNTKQIFTDVVLLQRILVPNPHVVLFVLTQDNELIPKSTYVRLVQNLEEGGLTAAIAGTTDHQCALENLPITFYNQPDLLVGSIPATVTQLARDWRSSTGNRFNDINRPILLPRTKD